MSNLRYQRETRTKAEKPVKGHKGHVVYGAKYRCECGWSSCIYFGKGAQGQAAHEFYDHKLDCVVAELEAR